MGCIGVSIYHTDNGIYKIFNSHARDGHGRSHPLGTCVLFNRSTIDSELSTVFPGHTLTHRQF